MPKRDCAQGRVVKKNANSVGAIAKAHDVTRFMTTSDTKAELITELLTL